MRLLIAQKKNVETCLGSSMCQQLGDILILFIVSLIE
jgi:hypothetical protein